METNLSSNWDDCIFRSIDFRHVMGLSAQTNWRGQGPLFLGEPEQLTTAHTDVLV